MDCQNPYTQYLVPATVRFCQIILAFKEYKKAPRSSAS
jgi:hypothetical protein